MPYRIVLAFMLLACAQKKRVTTLGVACQAQTDCGSAELCDAGFCINRADAFLIITIKPTTVSVLSTQTQTFSVSVTSPRDARRRSLRKPGTHEENMGRTWGEHGADGLWDIDRD